MIREKSRKMGKMDAMGLRPFVFVPLAALVLSALAASGAAATQKCTGALHLSACAEATGSCPAVAPPLGTTNTDWPVFQQNVQHTGKSNRVGPTCSQPQFLWQTRVHGRVLSSPVIGPAAPGQQGNVYFGVSKNPICSLEPTAGGKLWCDTDQLGKDANYASPVLGNDDFIYIGTRDNDLWAVEIPNPEVPGSHGTVAWREKVCSDGDVTGPPIIGSDGVIYFDSDSLEAGTLMAMCPGPTRQVKWCKNPVGGPVSNVSPALSPAGDRVYATFRGSFLASYDAATGDEKWRLEVEKTRNNGKKVNSTPVVNPTTGRIYLGFDTGLFAVDTQIVGSTETPVETLLFPTLLPFGQRVNSPPALDVAGDAIYFGASAHKNSTLYAVTLNGLLKWKKDLGRGTFVSNPPVVDGNGNVYVALNETVYAFEPVHGNQLWSIKLPYPTFAPPVITAGRVYIGTKRGGYMFAVGCP